MKNVSILVPETAVMEAIGDPHYCFTAANEFLIAAGKKPLFNVQLVGLKKEVKLLNGLLTVHPNVLLKDVKKTDLIFIPALSGDLKEAVKKNEEFIPWIVNQYKQGAELASLCVGAFLLASTGLLNGRKCSTHWLSYNEFRETFPEVELTDGHIITEEQGIYSSGGANSYWNLLLHLLEKYTDRETAILASKFFAIDIDRESQSKFMIFNGQRNHNDEAIKKAQDYIEKHYQERITVDQLADVTTIGRRSFERRFKSGSVSEST